MIFDVHGIVIHPVGGGDAGRWGPSELRRGGVGRGIAWIRIV
jgi:hypothetical protein